MASCYAHLSLFLSQRGSLYCNVFERVMPTEGGIIINIFNGTNRTRGQIERQRDAKVLFWICLAAALSLSLLFSPNERNHARRGGEKRREGSRRCVRHKRSLMVSPSAACHTANGFRERERERAKVIVDADGDWLGEEDCFVLFEVFGVWFCILFRCVVPAACAVAYPLLNLPKVFAVIPSPATAATPLDLLGRFLIASDRSRRRTRR